MEGFPGTQNEFGDWYAPYKRQIPVRFQGDSAQENYYPVDKFTQSMLTGYSTEAVTPKGGNRTNSFSLNKEQAKAASLEILSTHFSMKGQEAEDFLSKKFDSAWKYYDVNSEGTINAERINSFYRYLTKSLGEVDLQ